MTEYICYHNGEFKKESEVCISFRDLGFQRAYGVFDYLRTYKHEPFQKEWHGKKLLNSISEMKIELNENSFDFLHTLDELFYQNKSLLNNKLEYGVRTIVTGGVNGKATVIMHLEEFDNHYPELQKTGVALLAKKSPRQSAGSKNIDYKALLSAKRELEEKDCLEILHRGYTYVYESGTSNLFMIKDNVIITPKENVYCGSTRNLIIDIIKENGMSLEERFITWDEFVKADEVFISASKKEILPVVKIYNDDEILKFKIGVITKKLIKLFKKKKT